MKECKHIYHLVKSELLWTGWMFKKQWTRRSLFVCDKCGELKTQDTELK